MKLNAENLKNELWATLKDIQSGHLDARTANAIAGQARGIIATVNTEILIQTTKQELSESVKNFSK